MTEPLFAKLRTLLEEERYTELPLYLLPPSLILFLESKDKLFAALDSMEEALIGFSKHCIKPQCVCWACNALTKVREMGK